MILIILIVISLIKTDELCEKTEILFDNPNSKDSLIEINLFNEENILEIFYLYKSRISFIKNNKYYFPNSNCKNFWVYKENKEFLKNYENYKCPEKKFDKKFLDGKMKKINFYKIGEKKFISVLSNESFNKFIKSNKFLSDFFYDNESLKIFKTFVCVNLIQKENNFEKKNENKINFNKKLKVNKNFDLEIFYDVTNLKVDLFENSIIKFCKYENALKIFLDKCFRKLSSFEEKKVYLYNFENIVIDERLNIYTIPSFADNRGYNENFIIFQKSLKLILKKCVLEKEFFGYVNSNISYDFELFFQFIQPIIKLENVKDFEFWNKFVNAFILIIHSGNIEEIIDNVNSLNHVLNEVKNDYKKNNKDKKLLLDYLNKKVDESEESVEDEESRFVKKLFSNDFNSVDIKKLFLLLIFF